MTSRETGPGSAGDDARAGTRASADAAATDAYELPGAPDAFERLWNAHRMAYVSQDSSVVKDEDTCPFCVAPRRDDEDSLIVHRGRTAYVVLNLYPYNPGHAMVVPYRKVAALEDLTTDESRELMEYTQHLIRVIKSVSRPDSFNVGLNLGSAAGGSLSEHLHQHVVPRWIGDANFITVTGGTKVLPQLLRQSRRLLAEAWPVTEPGPPGS